MLKQILNNGNTRARNERTLARKYLQLLGNPERELENRFTFIFELSESPADFSYRTTQRQSQEGRDQKPRGLRGESSDEISFAKALISMMYLA